MVKRFYNATTLFPPPVLALGRFWYIYAPLKEKRLCKACARSVYRFGILCHQLPHNRKGCCRCDFASVKKFLHFRNRRCKTFVIADCLPCYAVLLCEFIGCFGNCKIIFQFFGPSLFDVVILFQKSEASSITIK